MFGIDNHAGDIFGLCPANKWHFVKENSSKSFTLATVSQDVPSENFVKSQFKQVSVEGDLEDSSWGWSFANFGDQGMIPSGRSF